MYSDNQLSLFTKDILHHAPQNQREAFLFYMSKMDAEMINLVLDDNKTYQDAKKEVFTEKLSEVLSEFIAKGDTELDVVKGKCDSSECHKGCPGYAFIGNCSGTHLDLIVEGSNTQILDIYHCSSFKADTIELDTDNSLSIDIYPDEEVSFQPTEEYLMTLHRYNNACDEILKNESSVLDIAFADKWLEKHKELIQSFDIF